MLLEEFRKKYNYHQATTMMKQYLDIKYAHLECLLLFRMGDFYELFHDDAISASKVLGIVLSKRGRTGDAEIPMCGVPHHALETYLNKLLEEGYKVAICDQLESPEEAKKRGGYKAVVNRDVTRIITPGTITEESLITTKMPNYLASLVVGKNRAAICYVDLSISEISIVEIEQKHIIDEISWLKPKEILLNDTLRSSENIAIFNNLGFRLTYQVDSFFAIKKCQKILLDFYKIPNLSAIGELTDLQISALGSIIEYLALTQKQHLPKLPMPKIVNNSKFVTIDAATRRNLEITTNLAGGVTGSLLSVIDNTITKSGSRMLYRFISSPLADIKLINTRLQLTDFFYTNLALTKNLRNLFKKIGDLERCLTRISMNKSSAKDLLSIKYTMKAALEIKDEFTRFIGINLPDFIERLVKPLEGDKQILDLIESAIREDASHSLGDGGFIKHEYHAKVEELYSLINNSKYYIEKLKQQYQEETSIDNLKIQHNNMLGLFIEITARHSSKILDPKFIHRQTTANTIRYTTLGLQRLESDIVNARALVISLEQELFQEICQQILQKIQIFRDLVYCLSKLDVFANFAHIADEYNYVKPELSVELDFEILDGRHPVVEKVLHKANAIFVKNDCDLSESKRIYLITGPNMSGKSTFLRQNALITILAQMGSFVSASKAKIGVVDKIFSRIGSGDDLLKGQSTFMVEMIETSAILAQSTERSLIILDEVGRGTSTYDGVSIAWAVLEYIHDKIKSRCLFATHYHELTDMSNFLPALRNYTVEIEEWQDNILFLHRIIPGIADKSYGVHVAELAGLPKQVIAKAKEMVTKFEKISVGKNKNILKSESNNLSLFDANMRSKFTNKYIELIEEIKLIDPEELSPKAALEKVFKIKAQYDKVSE